MILHIDPHIRLELIAAHHAAPLFELIDSNRAYLRKWLTFVDYMSSLADVQQFVLWSNTRHEAGTEFAFVILSADTVIGRIGIYKIDSQHKVGEIGYWVAENQQGKGIIAQCCRAIVEFGFLTIDLNRLEIKCGTQNLKSKHIAEALHFTREGIIRQGEYLNGKYVDLYLYSLLKKEYSS
jgi:ribosomal-protein-serine acetyltransferase